MLDVVYHHAKFGRLGFHPLGVEFFVCLSRFVVRHAIERQSLFARFRHEVVVVQKWF